MNWLQICASLSEHPHEKAEKRKDCKRENHIAHNKLLSSWHSTIQKRERYPSERHNSGYRKKSRETGKKSVQEVVVPLIAVTD